MINLSNANGLKSYSRAVLTAVITFVLAMAIFATTAFAGLVTQYNVEVVVDSSDAIVITTNETEPIEILAQANITLDGSDRLDISGFTSGEGGTIKIDRSNDINIEFDGLINTYTMYEDTVGEALSSLGIVIGSDDKVNYALSAAVQNGMVITVSSAKHVTLTADGNTANYAIYNGMVADLLELAQITLGTNDYTIPSLNTMLEENMVVEVYRVELETVTQTETVAYDTITQQDSTADRSTTTVVTEGVDGEERVAYEVKYVNGEEIEKTELSRVTVREAVDKVVKVGTNTPGVEPNGVTSRNGYTIGQTISGRYTYYCACGRCGSGTGITASGKRLYNGMNDPYYIACNWLPLGSVVNVNGTNYTVVDRGGSGLSSRGRIDIFTPDGHSACFRYGTGSCSIEIVRLGW